MSQEQAYWDSPRVRDSWKSLGFCSKLEQIRRLEITKARVPLELARTNGFSEIAFGSVAPPDPASSSVAVEELLSVPDSDALEPERI
jgi:hypothetical protein